MQQLIKHFLSGFSLFLVVFYSNYLKTVKIKKTYFNKNKYQLQFIRIDVIFQFKSWLQKRKKAKVSSLVYDLYLNESTKINT